MVMAAVAMEGLFSDEVFTATELNRRGGTILDRARLRPVTISRNNEQFALLRRDQAANLVGTVNRIVRAVLLLSQARTAIAGGQVSEPFRWLEIYEKDDLEKLVTEVLSATLNAASGDSDWDEVEALIHEWRESANVAKSGLLDAAMYHEPSGEAPLEHPEEILRSALQDDDADTSCPTTKG
jgi:hypothetical protein